MVSRNHFRVMVSLALAFSLQFSSSEGSKDLSFFHQRMTNTPRICKPQVLDRAVHCGCFRYRTFYRKYPEWSSLAEFCEGESDERLTSSAVLDDCKRSQFARSGKTGLGQMNKYFKRANDVCMTPSKFPPRESEAPRPTEIGTKPLPSKVPSYDVPPYDVTPSEEPLPTEPPYEMPLTKAPQSKIPTAKVPAATAIPKTTLASEGKIYPSPATLEAKTVRLRYEFIHKMLSRFCLVLFHRRRTGLTAQAVSPVRLLYRCTGFAVPVGASVFAGV